MRSATDLISEGQHILFTPNSAVRLRVADTVYLLLDEGDVLARIED